MPLTPFQLINLIQSRRFGAEYQPLVCCASGKTVGHEALARFYLEEGQPVPPHDIFASLHDSPVTLFQVEYELKRLQVERAPADGLLFLNIDPDAYRAGQNGEVHPLLNVVKQAGPRAVVEIIENSSITDAALSLEMARAFQDAGVRLALDDIGEPHSMLSLPVLLDVDYFKMDRSWLEFRNDRNWMSAMMALIGLGRELGKTVIMEGVETEDQLDFAREIGCHWAQGWLFRERFVNVRAQPA